MNPRFAISLSIVAALWLGLGTNIANEAATHRPRLLPPVAARVAHLETIKADSLTMYAADSMVELRLVSCPQADEATNPTPRLVIGKLACDRTPSEVGKRID
jgi:hypothetical protein